MDGGVDQGLEPQRPGQARKILGDPCHLRMRNRRDLAPAGGDDVMFQPLQDEAVQVDEIASEIGLDDLAGAVGGKLAAKHEPRQQQHAVGRAPRPTGTMTWLRSKRRSVQRHLAQRGFFLARQIVPRAQLSDEQFDVDAHAGKSAQEGVRSVSARLGKMA